MYCPEHLIFRKGGLWIWLYWHDVPREQIPLRVWLNPLRYQVSYTTQKKGKRLFIINREGMWWGRLYWVFAKHLPRYRK